MARKSSRGRERAVPVQMHFDDNRLLALLFGEHDRNLAVLEDRLGISVASRGNRLAITGPDDAAAIARTALAALYRDLAHGAEIGPAEVEAAITRAGGGGGTVLTTRKRAIAPRSQRAVSTKDGPSWMRLCETRTPTPLTRTAGT